MRSAHAAACSRLRQQGSERCFELVRLLEIEEQTRCQAFQGVLMGEVNGRLYQSAVRSILEKLLAKLETWSHEPTLYRGAAQCLSEYMSSLNHHCDTLAVPSPSNAATDLTGLDAIVESEGEDKYNLDASSICSAESLHSDSTLSSVRSDRVLSLGETSSQCLGFGGETVSTAAAAVSVLPTSVPQMHVMPTFTASKEELRKERRRESNRNASTKYRSKKTATLSTLMAENAQLRQQVASFSSQCAVLGAENKLLKQQVSFLQGILQGQGQNAAAGTASNTALASPTLVAEAACEANVAPVEGNLSFPGTLFHRE